MRHCHCRPPGSDRHPTQGEPAFRRAGVASPDTIEETAAPRCAEGTAVPGTGSTSQPPRPSPNLDNMDATREIREFLATRRAKITPEQAGLPAFGNGKRRVPGLRREEVALLAGVSIDHYVRLERGQLAGASEEVLDALCRALQLDDAERSHLYDLAAAQRQRPALRTPCRTRGTVPACLKRVLESMTGSPAFIRNGRLDILAVNELGRALYAPVHRRGPPGQHRPLPVPRPCSPP